MTVYGYARVSTQAQDLEIQIQALQKNGADIIFEEKFTGTKTDRPQFNELLSKLKEGDTLMVTKLDRIARSATQGSEIVKELIDKGVKVNILNMGLMDNTPASRLVRTIFFAFAEFERDMIVERTQEGKAIAKQQEGFKEGRPKKYTQYQLDEAMKLLETMSFAQVEKEMALRGTKISMSTLKRESAKRKATK